jgi:hypothetical protein
LGSAAVGAGIVAAAMVIPPVGLLAGLVFLLLAGCFKAYSAKKMLGEKGFFSKESGEVIRLPPEDAGCNF